MFASNNKIAVKKTFCKQNIHIYCNKPEEIKTRVTLRFEGIRDEEQ